MRLKGSPEAVKYGWTSIIENAEPADGYRLAGFRLIPVGVMDSCYNFVRTADGRLAVRGGSQAKLTLNDTNNMTSVLAMERYSQDGSIIVAHDTVGAQHHFFLYSADLGTLVHKNSLLGWSGAEPSRPRAVELFEKLYVTDATEGIAGRQQMVAISADGTQTNVQPNIGGSGTEILHPYCAAVYNNVLFIAGQDFGETDAPAMVRHSFLGQDPSVAAGWDPLAFNTIGAAGEYVRAMEPGNSILLIAKESELYRLTGFGQALPGWQYRVQPVDNTDYLGVKWPGALRYAEGYWYGVAESGPWRSDGQTTEILVRPRLRSWQQVTALDRAVVRYDPFRRVIMFGFVIAGQTQISRVWLWDIDAEHWVSDWILPVTVNDFVAVAEAGLAAPTGAPGTPSITHTSATLTTVTGVAVLTDTSASTEIWIDRGAGFVKDQVLVPAATAFTISGLTNSTAYPIQARHIKNGIASGYGGVAFGYTLLQSPQLSASVIGPSEIDLTLVQQSAGSDLKLLNDSVLIKTWAAQPNGTVTFANTSLSSGTQYTYVAESFRGDWPSAIQTSAPVTVMATTTGSGGGGGLAIPSVPTFNASDSTLTAVTATFSPGDPALSTEVWANQGSGYVLITTLTPATTTFTIPSCPNGTAIPCKLRHKDGSGNVGAYGSIGTGFTLLPAPTVSNASSERTSITVSVHGAVMATVTLQRDGITIKTWTNAAAGTNSFTDIGVDCGNSYTYSAFLTRSDWPAGITQSATTTESFDTLGCGGGL